MFGFAGLSLQGDGMALDPRCRRVGSSLGFGVQWRGRRLKIKIDQDRQFLEATLEAGEPMTLAVGAKGSRTFRGSRAAGCHQAVVKIVRPIAYSLEAQRTVAAGRQIDRSRWYRMRK